MKIVRRFVVRPFVLGCGRTSRGARLGARLGCRFVGTGGGARSATRIGTGRRFVVRSPAKVAGNGESQHHVRLKPAAKRQCAARPPPRRGHNWGQMPHLGLVVSAGGGKTSGAGAPADITGGRYRIWG